MAFVFRNSRRLAAGSILFGVAVLVVAMMPLIAGAAGAGVGLGTADPFAVLGGSGVTNTGSSIIDGDLGSCPTPAITGFPPGIVTGTIHANDAVACGAQSDTTTAYDDAAGRAPTTTYGGPTDLGGLTVVGGVYKTPTSFAVTGTLTLDGQNDPDSTFVFQAGSTVITATNSSVSMINGAQACNVFWQVGSSATLGVGSTLIGTVMALSSITADTNAVIQGRLLARNGAVTLDSNTITRPSCVTPPTSVPPTSVPPTSVPPTSVPPTSVPPTSVPGDTGGAGPTTTTSPLDTSGPAATTTTERSRTTGTEVARGTPGPDLPRTGRDGTPIEIAVGVSLIAVGVLLSRTSRSLDVGVEV